MVFIPLLSVLVAAAGCGFKGMDKNRDHPKKKQTRPIGITLYQKNATSPCEARFSTRAQHAFNDDDIAWEFTNTCTAAQVATLDVHPGSGNPFTGTAPPWKTGGIANGDMGDIVLTVGASGTVATGVYKFDIIVGGTRYDPRLEIDP